MFKYLFFVISLLVCASFSVFAQTPDTAMLRGQVVDQTHAGIVGARVTVTNRLTGLHQTVSTDGAGNFYLGGLPVSGSYSASAVKTGFASAQREGISLIGGSSANVELMLNVAGGRTEVTVTGAVDEVRIDQPQFGIHLNAGQIQDTPLYGRKLTFLPLLNAANRPAVNQGDIFMNQNLFTTNGSGRRQAWFEVDGSNANDSWGRQTIFTNIPLVAVDEMSVLTNSFSAEYGGSAGSVVNVITKSGGNEYHGEVLELWRPSGPEAALSGFTSGNATAGNDITNDTLGQTSASISGPVGAQKLTHFFLGGEYSRQDRASPVTSALAPGNFIGHYRDWLGTLRLDRQISGRNNVFLRGSADGFYDTNPNGTVGGNNLPSVARTFRRKTYSAELGDTTALSVVMVNSARLQFQLASPITQFDPAINGTQFVVPIGTGTFTSGTSQSALLMSRQYEITDTLALSRGRHQIKFGGSAIYAHNGGNSKEFGGPIYLGKFTYFACPSNQTAAYCESPAYLNDITKVQSYQQSYGNANYTVDDTLWSLFAQDDYHLNRQLTVNLGLRYEQQTFTDSRGDVAPRVGFVYDVRGDGKFVARGGFGIYHSQVVDNSAANWALTGPTGVFNYTAAPGQVGFPSTVASAPLPAFPSGARVPLRSLYVRPGQSAYLNRFFPTSTLVGYQSKLLNPYSEQWTIGIEQQLFPMWTLAVDYVGTHTLRINRPLDVDSPSPFVRTLPNQVRTAQQANCTRPYWISWYAQAGKTCNPAAASTPQPPYSVIQSDVNDGYSYYDALDVNLRHSFRHGFSMLASYTWSHAIDNVDPDVPGQNPNDANFTGHTENGNAIFDQRHRFVLSGTYIAPFKIRLGGVTTLASGLPYNFVTGVTNSGNIGATTDRPVINGAVVGRDTGRGGAIYQVDPFVSRVFPIFGDRVLVDLRAESFNLLNHANFVGYSGTYGNGSTPLVGFGLPLQGVTNQLPARSFQFSGKVSF
ncbi:MAG: TonB-dependent receptor [Edaphobacter sp.]